MAKAAPVFYCVQGEDDINHPNAFFVPRPADGSKIGFDAFLQHFPFSKDAFHFRFQVPSPDGGHGYVWMDCSPDQGGPVPDHSGRIFCKVLRLKGRDAKAAPRPQRKAAPAAAPVCRRGSLDSNVSPKSPSAESDPFGSGKASRPSSSSPASADPFGSADPFADNPFGTSPKPAPATSVGQPEDLKGTKLNDQIAHRIEMWRTKDGKEVGGTGIRNLLCSLHQVLWEGANWKEVPLRCLITPQDVKKNYQKGVRATHPDRVRDSPSETRLVAERIFETLNNAWRDYEQKELGK